MTEEISNVDNTSINPNHPTISLTNSLDRLVPESFEIEIDTSTDDITTPEIVKLEDVKPLKNWQYAIIYGIVISFVSCIVILIIIGNLDNYYFFGDIGIKIGSIVLISFLCGKFCVKKFHMKINYTRKINHFAIWVVPFILDKFIEFGSHTEEDEHLLQSLWNISFAFLGFAIFTIPIRTRDKTGFIDTIFCSLDRPEDRPNTLLWLTIQNIFTALSLIPFILLWNYWDKSEFIFIPLLIGTIGDGFAEVIGIRFGKHKYQTIALCTDKTYVRSLEGSSCVFISAIIIISILYGKFTTWEFISNLLTIPILSTITEAYAPHTLDNPFIVVVSSGLLTFFHAIFNKI